MRGAILFGAILLSFGCSRGGERPLEPAPAAVPAQPATVTFTRTEHGIAPRLGSPASGASATASVTYPQTADEAFEVAAHGVSLRARMLGAAPISVTLDGD